MKYIISVLVFLLALTFPCISIAGDSGLYFDKSRNGEGLDLHRDGERVVAFLYTYGGEDAEIGVPIPPYVSPQFPLEFPLNGQRWFLMSGDPLIDDLYVEGLFYQTGGINFPVRLHPLAIGTAEVVGTYVLERYKDGWQLIVTRTEDSQLAEYDPLFSVPFLFGSRLFISGD